MKILDIASLKVLEELTNSSSIAGNELETRDVMRNYLRNLTDKIYTDKMGNLICEKNGDQLLPKVGLACHMDEVGFIITEINAEGYIFFHNIGRIWEPTIISQKMNIITRSGKKVVGVVGSIPPHIMTEQQRNNPVTINQMFIDVGCSSMFEVMALGVNVGDAILPINNFSLIGNENMIMAKSLDNRVGCAVLIDIMKELNTTTHPNLVCGIATVQEEVGRRGAIVAAKIVKPDIAIVVDTGVPGDTPGIVGRNITTRLGNGPQILLLDSSHIVNRNLFDFVIETAKLNDIPYQVDIMPWGGTDAGSINTANEGIPTISILVPTRYIHTPNSIISIEDYNNTVRLITNIIKRMDLRSFESIIKY
ncbi:M42 family metallopeptidase [Paenibacillus sp. NPDC057967]|uniref:M42 family metallopeptidase n=1 Tax=Paenibacillus sp. NPDC057967 TaxID=3346293 RepID=UPI0036D84DA0